MHNINFIRDYKIYPLSFQVNSQQKEDWTIIFCHMLKYIHVYNKDIFVFATRNDQLKLILCINPLVKKYLSLL